MQRARNDAADARGLPGDPDGSTPVERRFAGSRRSAAWAFASYCLVSFAYFGVPVVAHPGRTAVGSDNDPKLFIWMFAWWPHAIAHGLNPIYTQTIWAPSGIDLAWITSVPALALVFAPVTALAGPVVAYNLAAIVLPALAAWTAFLLCRHLTRSWWSSLFGGYLFGFTSYVLGHEQGHLHLVAMFPVPLVVLVVLRGLRGELGRRGLAWRLGVLLGVQCLLSTEVLATLAIASVLGVVLALALVPAVRRPLASLAVPVTAGCAIGAVIAGPIVYYLLTDFVSDQFTTPAIFVADAVNLVVPTRTAALGGDSSAAISAHWLGDGLEQTAYLGGPLILLLVALGIERVRDRAIRFLIAFLAAALILAFGGGLHVDGHSVAVMPWSYLERLPVFDNVFPERFTLYVTLAAAVGVAVWCATSRLPRWFRVALPYLVLASLVPNLGKHHWDEKLVIPPLFSSSLYERCFAPNENVLVLPYGYTGSSLLWQALSGFRFRMPGGEVGPEPPHSFRVGIVDSLRFDGIPAGQGADVVTFAHDKNVSTIVVDPNDPVNWASLLTSVGPPRHAGGLLLYRIGDIDPAAYKGC